MRFRHWSRFSRSMVVVTALLSCVGCAATPTNPFQRLVHRAGAAPAEQHTERAAPAEQHTERAAPAVNYTDGATANRQVSRASYTTNTGREQRTSCVTGGG